MTERALITGPTRVNLTSEETGVGERLDVALTQRGVGPSRAAVQKLIEQGHVLINGIPARAGHKIRAGDRIEAEIPPPTSIDVEPEALSLDILFEDQDVVVINKPRGMAVHPGAGLLKGTLVNALLAHCRDLSGIGGKIRPGIVHRLDKDTTGVLVVAKNDTSHLSLAQQIKDRTVTRRYLALVHGEVREESGTMDTPFGRHPVERHRMAVLPHGGRRAVTHFTLLERLSRYSLLDVRLETGRTHQIRVHMAHMGHPIVGDPVYGRRRAREKGELELEGQALHARLLGFLHPRSGAYMEFAAPPPDDFRRALEKLGNID